MQRLANSTADIARRLVPKRATLMRLAPGVMLVAVIGGAAQFLSGHYGGPAMLFALLLGMAFHFLADDTRTQPGIDFGSKTLLRLGVALLGARVTAAEMAALGWEAAAVVVGLIAFTIGVGFLIAPLMGRGWRFALLTGGSVAICGASAALALAAAIPKNDLLERNTIFTVASVTALSTIAMVIYPLLFSVLGFDDRQTGFLIGATIHDVAQVVGAGYSVSEEAGDLAALVKLMRVTMLPVVLLIVLLALRGRGEGGGVKIPSFVIGFLALAAVNSLGLLPGFAADLLSDASRALLVIAIAGIGVKTSLQALARVGGGHAVVVVTETVLLAAAAVALLLYGMPAL
jgi:uncharacterized integral membrane protein (TIGR00698 family)